MEGSDEVSIQEESPITAGGNMLATNVIPENSLIQLSNSRRGQQYCGMRWTPHLIENVMAFTYTFNVNCSSIV